MFRRRRSLGSKPEDAKMGNIETEGDIFSSASYGVPFLFMDSSHWRAGFKIIEDRVYPGV